MIPDYARFPSTLESICVQESCSTTVFVLYTIYKVYRITWSMLFSRRCWIDNLTIKLIVWKCLGFQFSIFNVQFQFSSEISFSIMKINCCIHSFLSALKYQYEIKSTIIIFESVFDAETISSLSVDFMGLF